MHWDLLERIYSALERLYLLLFGIVALLGYIGLIAALAALNEEASAAQYIYQGLGITLLCLIPILAHHYSAVFLMLGECFPACIGFLFSGAAYLTIRLCPPIKAAVNMLPMACLCQRLALILAVILPFVLWLAILVVVWRGRKGPYGNLFFGQVFPEKGRSPAEWLREVLHKRARKKVNRVVAIYSIKNTKDSQFYSKETKVAKRADNRLCFEALDLFSCDMGLFAIAGYWSEEREAGLMEIINLNGRKLEPLLKGYADLLPGDILEDCCFLASDDKTAMYKADKKWAADLFDIDEIASVDIFKDARTLEQVEAQLGCPILEYPQAKNTLYIHIGGEDMDDV